MAFVVHKIIGLSSTLVSITAACNFFVKYAANIRPFVPEGELAAFDAFVPAIVAMCDILKGVARAQIDEVSSP